MSRIIKTMLGMCLSGLLLVSCDLLLEEQYLSPKTSCIPDNNGDQYMDYTSPYGDGVYICGCDSSNYYFNLDNHEDSGDTEEPLAVCIEKSNHTYLLVSECDCTNASYNQDSLIIKLDRSWRNSYDGSSPTFFSYMTSGKAGLFNPYYNKMVDGDLWGGFDIRAHYSDTSEWTIVDGFKKVYSCKQYEDSVRGRIDGKFNSENTVSTAMLYWYNTADVIIDSCRWTLYK